ncbi:MAG TPA: folate-binding protein [Burkholderiaceae bacterium]|nr:folate-binding protein [Burkholderiaceae bacterium]
MSQTLVPHFDDAALRGLIQGCGARYGDDPHGPQALFDASAGTPADNPADALRSGGLMLLADWGIVSIDGADAASFLHAQTTNDIEHQALDEMRWHGYCTPKGRLLAGGPLWRDGSSFRFAVARPLADPLRQRLSRFVLRAKAKITDDSDALLVLGLTGRAAPAALRALGIEPPAPLRVAGPEPVEAAGATAPLTSLAIGLQPADDIGDRWWLVVPTASLPAVWATLSSLLQPLCSNWWRSGEILAGEPRIVAATSEAHVPQTLNWDLIEGLSFRKGCYPGQEVVARLHYRGKPKRRSFAAWVDELDSDAAAATPAALAPGAEIYDGADPVGTVVSSAPAPQGGTLLLYEAPIDIARRGGLSNADGQSLEPRELPYPLPDDGAAPADAGTSGSGS